MMIANWNTEAVEAVHAVWAVLMGGDGELTIFSTSAFHAARARPPNFGPMMDLNAKLTTVAGAMFAGAIIQPVVVRGRVLALWEIHMLATDFVCNTHDMKHGFAMEVPKLRFCFVRTAVLMRPGVVVFRPAITH